MTIPFSDSVANYNNVIEAATAVCLTICFSSCLRQGPELLEIISQAFHQRDVDRRGFLDRNGVAAVGTRIPPSPSLFFLGNNQFGRREDEASSSSF